MAGTCLVLAEGDPQLSRAHIGELTWAVVSPCWASAAFGDGERRRSGELPEDNSASADKLISPGAVASLPLRGREGGNGWESSRDCSAQPASNWVHIRSFSSNNRFACSRNSATYLACSSCLASNSWRQRRNWSS